MSMTPELAQTMRGANDDNLRTNEDLDSPTEPMIPIILAPHPTYPVRALPVTPEISPPLQLAPGAHLNGRPPDEIALNGNAAHAFPGTPGEPVTSPAPVGLAGSPAPVQPRRSQAPVVVGACFVAVQVILLLRVLLLLFNVNNSAAWVRVFYTASSVFALPFRLLLIRVQPLAQLGPEIISYVAPLLAILVYGLISRILVRFLKALLN
jgi:hypothetical protein